ncbi:MAG: glycosyltransferase family 2 protein, partial [Phycisphaerae bacterium]|nr:glycosyltransferase family 2 protein [Phycisphaerae bacterium]
MIRVFPHSVSILMPICNESEVVESVVEEWDREVFRYLPAGSELLFDDGASTDGTLEKLDTLREKHPYIRVLRSK